MVHNYKQLNLFTVLMLCIDLQNVLLASVADFSLQTVSKQLYIVRVHGSVVFALTFIKTVYKNNNWFAVIRDWIPY